jgi:hypothetical protein
MGRFATRLTRRLLAALVFVAIAAGGSTFVDRVGALYCRHLDARDVPGGFCAPEVALFAKVSPDEGHLAYAHIDRQEARLWLESAAFLGLLGIAFVSARRVLRAR